MTRVKGGTVARARRKKVLKQAKGYFGSKHRLYKTAHEQVMHSGVYAFRDRKQNKRNFRKLWITRINAGCRENEISYSRFIDGLNKAGVTVNRKMLSELAIDNPKAFSDLVTIAKDALNGKKYTPKEVKVETKEEKKPVEKKTTTKAAEKKEPAKKAETKTTAKKSTSTKSTTTKKTTTKKTAAKKPAAKKTTAKKPAAKKTAAKKTTAKKTTVKKTTAKKTTTKKTTN